MWVTFAICAVAVFAPIVAVPIGDSTGDGDGETWGAEIYNGQEATPNSWPWMAHLQRYGSFVCGATLLKKKWLVTAAHCVTKTGTYTAVLGDHNRQQTEGTEQTISVANIIIHPDYDASTLESDIALLELSSNADNSGSEVAKIARLADAATDVSILDPSTKCYITGWGYETDDNGIWRLAPKLQELDITILNNTRCTDVMLGYNDPTTNICYEAPLAASCNGDSGSPVVCRVAGKWTLVGVHSFKITLDGCRGGPKAGARVSQFKTWIESNI